MIDDNTIRFMAAPTKEVMRITKDGIFVPDDVAVDEAAEGVIAALETHIQNLVQRAVMVEREECAKVCEDIDAEYDHQDVLATWCANAIRARGQR
jgi:hypothetical protein